MPSVKRTIFKNKQKQYIGISRDHSGSMMSLSKAAMDDYNENIASIAAESNSNCIETMLSVVKCGVRGGQVQRDFPLTSIQFVSPISHYSSEGTTPLFDSVGDLIDELSAVPDVKKKNVSFLVMAITDGEENASRKWNAASLSKKIKQLQATDRWTFVFRVPKGYGKTLIGMGIPSGNIQEWETTERGLRESSIHTRNAFRSYYTVRSKGVGSTKAFYADLSHVKTKDVKAVLTNISKEVNIWPVKNGGLEIREFVEKKLRRGMQIGAAFYQLTKPEKAVQDYKMIVIRDKKTGAVYSGKSARDLLNLPDMGTIKLSPGDHGNYDIYIQSTSVNRKLIAGTNLLYWPDATASSHVA